MPKNLYSDIVFQIKSQRDLLACSLARNLAGWVWWWWHANGGGGKNDTETSTFGVAKSGGL